MPTVSREGSDGNAEQVPVRWAGGNPDTRSEAAYRSETQVVGVFMSASLYHCGEWSACTPRVFVRARSRAQIVSFRLMSQVGRCLPFDRMPLIPGLGLRLSSPPTGARQVLLGRAANLQRRDSLPNARGRKFQG